MKKGKLIIGLGVGVVAVAGAVFGAKKYQEKTGKSLLDKLNEAETPAEALEVHKEQLTEEMVQAALNEEEQEEKSLLEIVKSNKVKIAIVGAVVATVGIISKILSSRKNKKSEVNNVQEETDIDSGLKVQQNNNTDEAKGGGYNPNADIVDMDLKDNSVDMLGKE